VVLSRRGLGAAAMAAGVAAAGADLILPQPAQAVMGMTAGRVPGLAPADKNGVRRYTRPEGKSGGHGVGWTEITPYTFDVYEGWEEIPVSIADPVGGGNQSAVVATFAFALHTLFSQPHSLL
jgi:hypothetical protein